MVTDFSDRPWWIGNKPMVNPNIRCDFCGINDGERTKVWYGESYAVVYVNHLEDHLEPPQTVNICGSCHTRLHHLKDKSKLTEKWSERKF